MSLLFPGRAAVSRPRELAGGTHAGFRTVLFVLAFALATLGCSRAQDVGTRPGSPADDLPKWITPLLASGVRPDWSGDGRRLVYLDGLVGDVYELDLASGESLHLTGHFDHHGFTRARYLASGDLLLCGPGAGSGSGEKGDRWHPQMYFLPRDGLQPAQSLDEPCFEGPAVARGDMRIAWNRTDYPDEVLFGRSEIWTARVEVVDGKARLVDKKKRVDRSDFLYFAFLETQDFRPPDEQELIFSAYAYRGGEVMGVDLVSGEITNYSQDWAYDEAEGVFPDGRSVAVERELDTYTAVPVGDIDIWRLSLEDASDYQRLTYFTRYAGYGANNPVISPDGTRMAFGLRVKGGEHGNAQGIFLYDFTRAPR